MRRKNRDAKVEETEVGAEAVKGTEGGEAAVGREEVEEREVEKEIETRMIDVTDVVTDPGPQEAIEVL